MERIILFVGNIIHCRKPFSVEVLGDGFVAVKGNKIIAIGNATSLEEFKSNCDDQTIEEVTLKKAQILIPGLIDTHIHAPQYPNAGLGYDKSLLDWLNTYTYTLERKYKNKEFAQKVYDAVVKKTLSHGTTTACYFGTLHLDSTLTLVDCVIKHGQRALVGKVNMTQLAPDDYTETPEESLADTKTFITAVLDRKNELVKPIITPRFALSLEMNLMQDLAELAEKYNLHVQSHICETLSEVQMVTDLFSKDYAAVYDEANLLTSKTVLAHGIYLNDTDVKLIADRGTSIAHCPKSNTYLQSGLCDIKRLINAGINISLGTDVSGGPSASIVTAMRSAIETSIHLSYSNEKKNPLTYFDVLYLATLGGAKALGMEEKIGNFEVNKEFDALLIDMNVQNSASDFLQECNPLELLQKFIFLGDDRNVVNVYVAGKNVKQNQI